jgi:hypothetical protein
MDQSPNRFTVDQTWQEARSSPEQRRAGTAGLGSSPGALKNERVTVRWSPRLYQPVGRRRWADDDKWWQRGVELGAQRHEARRGGVGRGIESLVKCGRVAAPFYNPAR